jgi:glutamyl-tRNA reductase
MALEDMRAMREMDTANPVSEAVVLSTCNRLEVYAAVRDVDNGAEQLTLFLGGLQNIPRVELQPHLYHYEDDAAVTHLMRVASGLDSMILGEPQILGQVRQAYDDARAAGAAGAILSQLFTHAVHAGKRARTETAISRHTTSVARVGAEKVLVELQTLRRPCRVLIVGAGEMATLAAEVLNRSGNAELTFINRTFNRAEAMAAENSGRALAWHQLEEGLVWADGVISASGAPHAVISHEDLRTIVAFRADRELLIVDLSVPRDVEEGARDLPGIVYYHIDDLQSVLDAHTALRLAAVPDVEAVVKECVTQFADWMGRRQVTPVIRSLRDWAESVAHAEVEEVLSRTPGADDRMRQMMGLLADRLVNRLLHEPSTRLRMQAADGNAYGYAHALRELFALSALEMQCPRDREGCATPDAAPGTACNLECMGHAEETQNA